MSSYQTNEALKKLFQILNEAIQEDLEASFILQMRLEAWKVNGLKNKQFKVSHLGPVHAGGAALGSVHEATDAVRTAGAIEMEICGYFPDLMKILSKNVRLSKCIMNLVHSRSY